MVIPVKQACICTGAFILTLFAQAQGIFTGNSAAGYVDIVPVNTRYFAGIVYDHNYYSTTANHAGHKGVNNHYFHTWHILGKVNVHKRIQLFFDVPINILCKKKKEYDMRQEGQVMCRLQANTRYCVQVIAHPYLNNAGYGVPV